MKMIEEEKFPTLKDLKFSSKNPQCNMGIGTIKSWIRNVAIDLRKLRRNQGESITEEDWDWFFNITEEDLK